MKEATKKEMDMWDKGWNSLKIPKYLLYIHVVGTELGAGLLKNKQNTVFG